MTLPTSIALAEFSSTLTPAGFESTEQELRFLLHGCGIFDLGWRARIAVRGQDRLRWLSGMVTNAVQQLGEGEGNYSLFLNAQGRIQGDAFVYRDQEQLLLDTTVDQVAPLLAHLDHFIIMDDVLLDDLIDRSSALGLAGPEACRMLAKIGIPIPENAPASIQLHHVNHQGIELAIIALPGLLTPQFQILCPADSIAGLWRELLAAGAKPIGILAVEALRVLEGIPRYNLDISNRDLPQETGQARALNFNKGCYLGQEIVERIRSRGAVHRELRQFALEGDLPTLPADLTADGKEIGRLTSAVSLATKTGPAIYGLGIIRVDALNHARALTYNRGQATVLDRLPAVPSI